MKTGCCNFAVDLKISTGVDLNISLLLENDCKSGNFFGFYVCTGYNYLQYNAEEFCESEFVKNLVLV